MKWAHSILPLIDLPPTEVSVLLILSFHHSDKTGLCFPGIELLSTCSGAGERRTRQAIKKLADWRLISVKRGRGISGNASNRYTLFGKAQMLKQSGSCVPISTAIKPAQKSRFESSSGVPVSKRQTSADDRGYSSDEEKAHSKLAIILGGRA